jgi:hypothetical protein
LPRIREIFFRDRYFNVCVYGVVVEEVGYRDFVLSARKAILIDGGHSLVDRAGGSCDSLEHRI